MHAALAVSRTEVSVLYGEVGRLSDETIRLSLQLAETVALLTVAVQCAWLNAWAGGYQQAMTGFIARAEHRARTDRLIRRGVSPAAAAQGLRLV